MHISLKKGNYIRVSRILIILLFVGCSEYEKEYFENGTLKSKYPIVNGKIEGVAYKYYEDGNIRQESNWINDVKEGRSVAYYSNGNVELEVNFKGGKQNGWVLKYDSSGALQGKEFFVDGKLDGPFEEYYKNGEIRSQGEYFGDKSNRELYGYYPNGKPNIYQVIKADTVYYTVWLSEEGKVLEAFLPLDIELEGNSFCIKLLHSLFPEEKINVRIYFSELSNKTENDYSTFVDGNGFSVCSNDFTIENGIIEGYLCEVFKVDNTTQACMPFKFSIENGRLPILP